MLHVLRIFYINNMTKIHFSDVFMLYLFWQECCRCCALGLRSRQEGNGCDAHHHLGYPCGHIFLTCCEGDESSKPVLINKERPGPTVLPKRGRRTCTGGGSRCRDVLGTQKHPGHTHLFTHSTCRLNPRPSCWYCDVISVCGERGLPPPPTHGIIRIQSGAETHVNTPSQWLHSEILKHRSIFSCCWIQETEMFSLLVAGGWNWINVFTSR